MTDCLTGRYRVTSTLTADYFDELEALVFFNANQARVRDALRRSVERYGNPRIVTVGQNLTLELPKVPQVQTLFLLSGGVPAKLIGVVAYARHETILQVIFIGLDADYTYAPDGEQHLLLEVIELLRQVGHQIRGVKKLQFSTGRRELTLSL